MADHPSNRPTTENLHDLFAYHPPRDEEQLKSYQEVRRAGEFLARVILLRCPSCADRSAAVRKVRETVMIANAAIALEAPPLGEDAVPAEKSAG